MASEVQRRVQVVMSWGETPQSSVLVPEGCRVAIGPRASTFLVPETLLPTRALLVEREPDRDVVHVPVGATLSAWDGGERLVEPGGTAPASLTLRDTMQVEIALGEFRFRIEHVDVPAEAPRAPLAATGWSWVAASLAVHVAMLGIMALAPPDAGALGFDRRDESQRYVAARLTALEQNAVPPAPEPGAEEGGAAGPERSADASDAAHEAGTAGAVDEVRATGGGVRSTRRASSEDARPNAENVATAGALRTIASFVSTFGSAASPFDGAGAATVSDLDAYGALTAQPGFSAGTGGFGMNGTGRGTSCPPNSECGLGTVRLGGLGTAGGAGSAGATCSDEEFTRIAGTRGYGAAVTACQGRRNGYGAVSGTFGQRPSRTPTITTGQATVVGSLDRDAIRRVVARNRNQLRHCYEQALTERPDIQGRVVLHWIIDSDGRVSNASVAQGTDISYDPLPQCVARAVARWQFGAGGRPAGVTYPFLFQTPN